MHNYSVKMGFGLHVGWAIEGAIGSEFKIDASYLSPNVNMAARLEAATKQYGVPLLVSGAMYSLFSKPV
jgi:class 3 adenylate cyclase